MAARKRSPVKELTKLKPITRTIRLLRAQGWVVADRVEERRGLISFDWGGFADVIAWRHPSEWLCVQCTGNHGGDVRRRIRKIDASPRARAMVYAGVRIEVWGWRRDKEDPRVVQVMPQDLGCPVVALAAL